MTGAANEVITRGRFGEKGNHKCQPAAMRQLHKAAPPYIEGLGTDHHYTAGGGTHLGSLAFHSLPGMRLVSRKSSSFSQKQEIKERKRRETLAQAASLLGTGVTSRQAKAVWAPPAASHHDCPHHHSLPHLSSTFRVLQEKRKLASPPPTSTLDHQLGHWEHPKMG